jgi:hypothetical protein
LASCFCSSQFGVDVCNLAIELGESSRHSGDLLVFRECWSCLSRFLRGGTDGFVGAGLE